MAATRTDVPPPQIDGLLDDKAWSGAAEATHFEQWQPYNDRPGSYESYVKIVYDDDAIYIGANLADPNPDSILTELGIRDSDDRINADHFWIDINPFNDGVNGFTFKVSASGVQTDINRSGRGEEGISWNAAWKSKTRINAGG